MAKDENQKINKGLTLLAKSSVIVFIGLFLSKLFTYAYKVIIARYFGPEIYGLFALALIIVSLFVIFSQLGLARGLVRYLSIYLAKDQPNKVQYLSRVLLHFFSLTGIIFGIVLFLLSEFISVNIFHNPGLIIFLQIFSIMVILNSLLEAFLSILQAHEKIAWYSFIFNILQNFIKVVMIIFLIFIGVGSNAVIFSYLIAMFISCLVAYIVCKKTIPHIFEKPKIDEKEKTTILKEVFSYSWPMMFSLLAMTVFYLTDSLVIGYLLDASNVGFYNAATPIAALLIFAPGLFMQLFFPVITKEYFKAKKNLEVVKQLSQQIGKWIFILNIPLLILILTFPGAFINILFGSQYLVATTSLRFLAIGVFFTASFTISEELISMLGKSKVILGDLIFVLIINVSLNVILIKLHGISGAAFATMVSLILLNLLFLFQTKHYLSIVPLRRKMIKILLVSIVPLFLLLFIKQFIAINFISLGLLGSFFLLLYLFLIFTTGCLDKNDLMIIKLIKKKFSF
jgi:O-antigen/teichoic acid export membrane protein